MLVYKAALDITRCKNEIGYDGFRISLQFVRLIQKQFWIYRGNTLPKQSDKIQKSCCMLFVTMLFYPIFNTQEISIFALNTFAPVYPVSPTQNSSALFQKPSNQFLFCYKIIKELNKQKKKKPVHLLVLGAFESGTLGRASMGFLNMELLIQWTSHSLLGISLMGPISPLGLIVQRFSRKPIGMCWLMQNSSTSSLIRTCTLTW